MTPGSFHHLTTLSHKTDDPIFLGTFHHLPTLSHKTDDPIFLGSLHNLTTLSLNHTMATLDQKASLGDQKASLGNKGHSYPRPVPKSKQLIIHENDCSNHGLLFIVATQLSHSTIHDQVAHWSCTQ